MPTYEYECMECGYHFEKFQSMNEEPIKTCPECNGKVMRLMSKNVNFILKGSGFYKTDYVFNKNNGNGNGKEKKKQEEKHQTEKVST